MELKDYIEKDPDKHLKRVGVLGTVTKRVHNVALKRRQSIKIVTKEEELEKLLVCIDSFQKQSFGILLYNYSSQTKSKAQRLMRENNVDAKEVNFLVLAAAALCVDEEELQACYFDSSENLELFKSLFANDGIRTMMIQYQDYFPPSLGTFLLAFYRKLFSTEKKIIFN